MVDEKILPCPFCNKEPRLVSSISTTPFAFIKCDGCGAMSGSVRQNSEAIAAWNTRQPVQELVEALTVLLDEAENFSVSGVYFDEKCMGHKGPTLARAALANYAAQKGTDKCQ
jgi:Lar family restriction alleviation protein